MKNWPPHIDVIADGPYEVTGNIPVRPRRSVTTQNGEPVAWSIEDEVAHDETYRLCRCGQSRTKPFCDGSHAFELFDGSETASINTFDERAERHEGPGISVQVDQELCLHSRFCKYEMTNYYEMISDAASTNTLSQLAGMIDRCPSGALRLEIDGAQVETLLPQQVSPIADGPLLVTGGIEIERSDGEPMETRSRVSLCRCGASANKPLCDGSHIALGFKA
jgi:CDGSH-type Zn-finger protein